KNNNSYDDESNVPLLVEDRSEIPSERKEIPAADRFVHLDHNSNLYNDAVAALQNAIEEFRNDHHFGNSWEEKNALLTSLETGRQLLKQSSITMSNASAKIINPLKHVIQRYEKELVGGAVAAIATAALGLLIKLLGL